MFRTRSMLRNSLKFTLLTLIAVLIFTACSTNNNSNTSSSKPGNNTQVEQSGLEPVNLIWYYRVNSPPADQQLVQKAVNDYLKDNTNLNVTVELKAVSGGEYNEKMNAVTASQEKYDIAWTSNWAFHYSNAMSKGAFLPLDELVKKHAPQTLASMPEHFWDDTRGPDGSIYAIPNQQIAAQAPGVYVQKRFADKYKSQYDVTQAKTYRDLEPFFELIVKNEPNVIPFNSTGAFWMGIQWGLDITSNAVTYKTDDSFQVVEQFLTPEFQEYAKMANEWYKKGYITEEVIMAKAYDVLDKNPDVAVKFNATGKPGNEVNIKAQNGGHDVIFIPLSDYTFTGVSSTMNAISRTSQNPERAVMFLEQVNSDKDLFNLLAYGIKDRHYKDLGNNVIEPIQDSGYFSNLEWVFGNVFNGFIKNGQPLDVFEKTKEINQTAWVSPKFGFAVDQEPIKTEIANADAVKEEYTMLIRGGVDPDEYFPKFKAALETAGIQTILDEQKKQLDVYLQSK